eukprot:5344247-Prymnesium_polylepis.1
MLLRRSNRNIAHECRTIILPQRAHESHTLSPSGSAHARSDARCVDVVSGGYRACPTPGPMAPPVCNQQS